MSAIQTSTDNDDPHPGKKTWLVCRTDENEPMAPKNRKLRTPFLAGSVLECFHSSGGRNKRRLLQDHDIFGSLFSLSS